MTIAVYCIITTDDEHCDEGSELPDSIATTWPGTVRAQRIAVRFSFLVWTSYLSIGRSVYSVVVHPSFVSQGDRSLSRTALALSHEKAAVDTAAQEVLGSVPWHWSMIPRMLLQTVHRGDVVAGYPALSILRLGLAPFPVVVVAQDTELFTLAQEDNTFRHGKPGSWG